MYVPGTICDDFSHKKETIATMTVSVSDDFLLAFFRAVTPRLLDIEETLVIIDDCVVVGGRRQFSRKGKTLNFCRRFVLDHQLSILQETMDAHHTSLDIAQVQDRLGGLKHESDLSSELKMAMEKMNAAAKIAVCKLILYFEDEMNQRQHEQDPDELCDDTETITNEETTKLLSSSSSSSLRTELQDEGRLDRNMLIEYFGLCEASLKLKCVTTFMTGETSTLFKGNKSNNEDIIEPMQSLNGGRPAAASTTTAMFPQHRHEYVQQLLAKSMGWDPVFVTSELSRIFVGNNDKSKGVSKDEYYNEEIFFLFRRLVEQITVAVRSASLLRTQHQEQRPLRDHDHSESSLPNDLDRGGNTRVISVQHSEFEISSDGTKKPNKSNAPEKCTQEERINDDATITNEEKKRQLRLASEATLLQQTIIQKLMNMNENERKNIVKDAEEVSTRFLEQIMELSPGVERIDFLRNADPDTSRKLAIHKLWTGMVQQASDSTNSR